MAVIILAILRQLCVWTRLWFWGFYGWGFYLLVVGGGAADVVFYCLFLCFGLMRPMLLLAGQHTSGEWVHMLHLVMSSFQCFFRDE